MKTIDEQLDLREEWMNTLTHGIGIIFGLVSIPILIYNCCVDGGSTAIMGSIVYGISFLMMFVSSTLFHCMPEGKLRDRLKILDHICIYFLIAGTYTPFILIFVNTPFGHTLLAVLWALTFIGTIFKIFFTGRFEIVSTIIYLIMGWLLLSGVNEFFGKMPPVIVTLIICGGCLYTIGVLFYIWRWFAYHHAVWHGFVLLAAICHYSAVLLSV
jgi:hemolysin III